MYYSFYMQKNESFLYYINILKPVMILFIINLYVQ